MKLISYIFITPFLYFLSIQPFWVLHRLSDFLYLILRWVFPYRKKVILKNLQIAFPEKSSQERLELCHQFYRHFCDIIIESIKSFTISEKEIRKRHKLINPELVANLINEGKNVAIVGNHYNNWEYFLYSLNHLIPQNNPDVLVIYSKLKNPYFNKMIFRARSRMGSLLIRKNNVYRILIKHPNPYVICFAADQKPVSEHSAYWMNFMGADTPVFFGVEFLAKGLDLPVIFVRVKKVKRSQYEVYFEPIAERPKETPYGYITEAHMLKLAEDLHQLPQYWLWSHDRWKKKKPENFEKIAAEHKLKYDKNSNAN
jgi:Kdo2-lipid IVA lauroyltransferase/acyltransferase